MAMVRKGRQKYKSCSCLVVNRESKKDESDQFDSAFYKKFFNPICLSLKYLMKTVLFFASRINTCHLDV